MKLIIKLPTRGRPSKSVDTLKKYVEYADSLENTKIIVSIDEDDSTLNKTMFESIHPSIECIVGKSCGKIGAINRDIPDPSTFDILLLASDDMIPIVKGYDTIIRNKMVEHFPDTDGVLFFNDGYAKYNLNTLVICGSKYYQRFGYIYNPEYKSFFCDNEFMDVANKLGRQIYIHDVIIKHEHPANNSTIKDDELYKRNNNDWQKDKDLYLARKCKTYDVSVLICTIPSRIDMFTGLLNHINKLKQASSLAIEVLFDDSERYSIGDKRNKLLDKAVGKYCCFIDDDDSITEDYFRVIEESGLSYDCITLNGMMYVNGVKNKPFYHSLRYSKWSEDGNAYYRTPNHLNPIKTSIAKQVRFPSKNFGEDSDFSTILLNRRLLKTEYSHNKLQYIYLYRPSNKPVKPFIRNTNTNDVRSVLSKVIFRGVR